MSMPWFGSQLAANFDPAQCFILSDQLKVDKYTYVLLESDISAGCPYRFICRVAVRGTESAHDIR